MTETKKQEPAEIQRAYKKGGVLKLGRYQSLVVGSRSFIFLALFETVTLLTSRIPGALGIFLRKIFYPMILGKVGKGVIFGADVWLRHPKKIRIGDGVIIDDGVLLDAKGDDNEGITIGNNCYVGRFSVLSCKNGNITLGDYANISTFCNISSNASITIGEKTLLGSHTAIFATAHNIDDVDTDIMDQGFTAKGVSIGRNCWLGSGVSVVDGVAIGADSVIGAGAVVTKDIPQKSVAHGVPAKVIKKRGKKDETG